MDKMNKEKPPVPTNPEEEKAKGRLALWLDPSDIAFIADEWRKIPLDEEGESSGEIWGRIAFRCMACLHKAGVEYEPVFPDESEKYKKSSNKIASGNG